MSCRNCECPFSDPGVEGDRQLKSEFSCVIADAVQKVAFRPGEVLFLQGQSSSSLYSLKSGTVKICSHTADGREQIVGLSNPGNLLLGLQSMNEHRYAYTGVAATEVCACKINHKALLAHVHEKPDLAMRLIAAMNAQLAHSRALMEVTSHASAAAKIASFILLMLPDRGQRSSHFSMPFSRMEMAGVLGLSEETVCRMMASMKRSGVLYAPRGKIEIRDWKQLHAISEGDPCAHLVSDCP